MTLLFRNYFASLPPNCSRRRGSMGQASGTSFRIMLPMWLPIFVVGLIIQITGIWNDFLFGVIFTRPPTIR